MSDRRKLYEVEFVRTISAVVYVKAADEDDLRGQIADGLAAVANLSPSDPPLMQVDHAQPVPSSPDSGESRSRAAGPESEHAEPRRVGAPPPEASSYACERADRVELTADELDQMLVGQALRDAARLRSLAATFDSRLNRDKTYTGAQVAAMLRDGKGFDDSDIMPGSEFDGPVVP